MMHSPLFSPVEAPVELDEQRALVALTLVPGVGAGRIRSLMACFGSAAAILKAGPRALAQVEGIGTQTAAAISGFSAFNLVDEQFARAERCGARLVTVFDPDYPSLLGEIYDPPPYLWVRGAFAVADERAIAIVGTRRPSDYGRRIAHDLAAELCSYGFTIVSGLAYGIDAAAHRGALEVGGRTIAVLGSGVDRIYPGTHVALAGQIQQQGAVVSEYAIGTGPDAMNFPRRNRIISGLSMGVLIVEAWEKGGALITARLAVEHNREVFAVPGSIYSPTSTGCNRLIQRGHAKLVLGVADILEEFGMSDEVEPAAPRDPSQDIELSEIERTLYEALGPEAIHIDSLCLKTGLDPSTALVYLLSLEFKGLIRQLAGKQFLRA